MVGKLLRKLTLYLRAAAATHSANLLGLPLMPKSRNSPFCRGSYNTFLLWIKQLRLSGAACIFDVGANHGDFAQAASACFPQARIWLFEPLPALWPKLERQAKGRESRWSIQRFALGAATGHLPLQVAEGDDGIGSFLGFSDEYRHGNPAATRVQSIDTRVERLDDFCAREDIHSIDLLKIDVEGFEFDVLAGSAEMLRYTTGLIIEISLIRQAGGSPEALSQMMTLLNGAGFHVVDLVPSLFSRDEPWRPLEYNLLARRSPTKRPILPSPTRYRNDASACQ
jgi:FkbM family methyltransferase